MKAIESTEQAAEVAKMYLEKRGYSEVKAVGELGKAVSLVATDPEARALAFVKVVLERDAASPPPTRQPMPDQKRRPPRSNTSPRWRTCRTRGCVSTSSP